MSGIVASAVSAARGIRRRLRRARTPLQELSAAERLRRGRSILSTPYWRLLFHDRLNAGWERLEPPLARVVAQESEWTLLEVGGCRLFWPACELGLELLPWLYLEVFAPAGSNPHAYEDGAVRIREGDWVVDAGASEGFFTHYALRRGASVLAVEPVPSLAEGLRRTFALEVGEGRVRVLEGALGATSGWERLRLCRETIWMSELDVEGSHTARVYTLDEIVEDRLAPAVDFVKMDIEGSETTAFRGGARLLRCGGPRLSVAVYHGYDNARLLGDAVRSANCSYHLRPRGLFIRDGYGPPRPYLLHATRCEGTGRTSKAGA